MLAPLAEVANVAQEIGETDDLAKRLHVHADDEVGQLATNFNAMLDRLESSRAGSTTRSAPSDNSSPTPRTSCVPR